MDIFVAFFFLAATAFFILNIVYEKYQDDSENRINKLFPKIKFFFSSLLVIASYTFLFVLFIFILDIPTTHYDEIISKKENCLKFTECQTLLNQILEDGKITIYEEIRFNLKLDSEETLYKKDLLKKSLNDK